MTLILSYSSRLSVIQMSDRLTTTTSGHEFDREANKTLVLIASDGYASISFCGLAFLKRKPADIYLAEALTGKIPDFFGNVPNMGPCLNNKRRKLDDMIFAIVKHAEQAFIGSLVAKRNLFGLSINGWRIRDGRQLTFGFNMMKPKGKLKLKFIEKTIRRADTKNIAYTGHFPYGYIGKDGDEKMSATCNIEFDSIETFYENWESCFVDLIRSAAHKTGLVGLDAMMVILPPIQKRKITIKHIPIVSPKLSWKFAQNIPATFSPWIIGQRSFMAPSLLTGGGNLTYHVNGIDVELNSPSNDKGVMYIGGHPRRML